MSFEQANQCSATVEIFNNQCSMFNFLGLLGKREVVIEEITFLNIGYLKLYWVFRFQPQHSLFLVRYSF
jgi:hypothetical protein